MMYVNTPYIIVYNINGNLFSCFLSCFLLCLLFGFLLMDIFIFSDSACIFGVKAVCVLCIVLLTDFFFFFFKLIFSYSSRYFWSGCCLCAFVPTSQPDHYYSSSSPLYPHPISIIIPVHLYIPTRSLLLFELTFMCHSFISSSTMAAYRLSTDISYTLLHAVKDSRTFQTRMFWTVFWELATVLER